MIGQIIRLARERSESPVAFVAFLDQLADDYGAAEGRDDRVLITSCHRAKGCEWPLVILPELTDGSFPVIREGANDKAIEDAAALVLCRHDTGTGKACADFADGSGADCHEQDGQIRSPPKPLASRFLDEGEFVGCR